LYKTIVVGVIVLFIGVGIQPAFAVDILEKVDIETKNYLFETIIKIANNPDVQSLLKEFKINFYFDYDGKYVFRQSLFKNPELLFSMVFIKPEMTTQSFDKTYNQGIELIDTIGEKKAYEILESVEITNPYIINDLHKIVTNNKELSNRISTLVDLNAENDTIYAILSILIFMSLSLSSVFIRLAQDFENFPLLFFCFAYRAGLIIVRILIIAFLYSDWFDCSQWYPD